MDNTKGKVKLNDELLDRVAGGSGPGGTNDPNPDRCPLCNSVKDNGICPNLQCRNYGSYC